MTRDIESWDNYISGNFLKAINVNSETQQFVCTDVGTFEREDMEGLRLTLDSNGMEFDFDLNQTNAKKLKELGCKTPKEVLGKTLFFKKALVRNPKTNMEVEGLRVFKIQ